MKTFVYEALRGPEEAVQGQIDAEGEDAAVAMLLRRGLHVHRIDESKGGLLRGHELGSGWLGKIPRRELIRFTRDLASLLRAGLPLAQSLTKLQAGEFHAGIESICVGIRVSLEDGRRLSDALEDYPGVFDPMYINLVRAGEEGGELPAVLTRLADLGERRDETRSKLKMVMVYPSAMLGLGAITIIILLTFVVPMFTEVFRSTGQVLPLPTRALVFLGGFLRIWGWAVGIAAFFTIYGLRIWSKSARGQNQIGRILLAVPVLRRSAIASEIASFTRTLGTLLENGVTMVRSLEVAERTMILAPFRLEVEFLRERVRDGDLLSSGLASSALFPSRISGVIQVGEESGTLPSALQQIADDTEKSLDRELKVLMTLLEPAMIVFVGSIVGFIVMAVLLPIFELGNAIIP